MAGDNATGTKCPICRLPAVHRCSSCKEVSYCSKEHQKMDWKTHKNACKAYEIKNSDQLGRYLVAARDLNPGDVVISETPLIWSPKPMFDPERVAPCVGCYKPVNLDVGERCHSCGWPICSGLCKGLKDMRHHGLECMVLSLRPGCAVSNLTDFYRHDALLALRCLLAQKKFEKRFKKIMELQSHMEDRGPDTEIFKETDEFVVKYLQDKFLHGLKAVETELKIDIVPDISDKMIHTICGIIDVNCLDVNLNNGCELSALYFNTCMMEHNCVPNTKHSFEILSTDENNQYRITVKAAIPIKKGEHITTMYSHALWGTQARREHLKQSKYFSCQCDRCKDPTELGTYLSAMKCIGSGKTPCGGIILPEDPCDENKDWICDKCAMKIKSPEVAYLTSKMGEQVDDCQMGSPKIVDLEILHDKLSTFLHPNHYHLYSVKHSLVQLYGYQDGYLHNEMTMEMLEKKLAMCDELLQINLKIDLGNTRLSLYTGVLWHELYQVKFEKFKRDFNKRQLEDSEILKVLEEIKACLKKALVALDNECDGSSGQKLICVMKESEKKFVSWIKEHSIKNA